MAAKKLGGKDITFPADTKFSAGDPDGKKVTYITIREISMTQLQAKYEAEFPGPVDVYLFGEWAVKKGLFARG